VTVDDRASAEAWARDWGYFRGGRRLGVLREVARGVRMQAAITRSAGNVERARGFEEAAAYLESLAPSAPPHA